MKKNNLTSKYWICNSCASKKKWKEVNYSTTKIMGRCGYCKSKKEVELTPINDFIKKGIMPEWD